MDLDDRFRRLALASQFRCSECDDMKQLIRMGFLINTSEQSNKLIINALDQHIKTQHPERYTCFIEKVYPDWSSES